MDSSVLALCVLESEGSFSKDREDIQTLPLNDTHINTRAQPSTQCQGLCELGFLKHLSKLFLPGQLSMCESPSSNQKAQSRLVMSVW